MIPTLEIECLHQFMISPRKTDCRRSFINLARGFEISNIRYVKCHIMLLFGTTLFGGKSGAIIREFSWGLTCLAHLYRALGRVSHFDCKKIDGPLTLLLTWVWIRLPFFAPIFGGPDFFRLQTGGVTGRVLTDVIDFIILLNLGNC
ncbi:hypothetical protein Ahy_B03g067458 isoform A [Arachis hypogaea]|uniref:Aminotransferase-like plant mobile domain-containing protein n=1 Tax=Arachis hypogaea TaxID=3818 RepID=A0A445A6X9_ARAHY|nr:hypothetical protein Ahy_B03g067458 isoform A [Arachis hypogaea]